MGPLYSSWFVTISSTLPFILRYVSIPIQACTPGDAKVVLHLWYSDNYIVQNFTVLLYVGMQKQGLPVQV